MQKTLYRLLAIAVLLLVSSCQPVNSDTSRNNSSELAPRSRLRICSQNIQRFTERSQHWSAEKQERQLEYLVTRMKRAQCDIVALQELVGPSKDESQTIANQIAGALSKRVGAPYSAIVASSNDRVLRNGMLYRADALKVEKILELHREPLPRLQYQRGPAGHYSRGPLAVLFSVTADTPERPQRYVMPVTMHFKSKSRGYKDPTGTEYEILRMQMAEGLRSSIQMHLREMPAGTIPLLLGDRNSEHDSATAAVLEGALTLESFRQGSCRVGKSARANCDDSVRPVERVQRPFVGLFSLRRNEQQSNEGTHRYRGKATLIDEILVRPGDLGLLRRTNGSLAIGLEGEFFKGSDHKLLWAELNIESIGESIGKFSPTSAGAVERRR